MKAIDCKSKGKTHNTQQYNVQENTVCYRLAQTISIFFGGGGGSVEKFVFVSMHEFRANCGITTKITISNDNIAWLSSENAQAPFH